MITPAPGYIVDPNNPNGVIRDPGSTATAPATSPTVATPTPTTPSAGDAQVLANQQAAAKLGISIPGLGTALPTGNITTPPATSPEDQRLLSMGITPEQLKGLNSPEGLDPTSFQNLIGNVTQKLKTNNELVTQRGYLMKQLYDHPLTPDEIKALPEDLQRVVASGDKDTIELQMRLMNDQIAGRANTLSQSIKYLADSYQTHVKDVEDSRNNAIGTVVDFVGQYGSKAPEVLASLYGPEYLAKLKAMGIDINAMSKITTLAQDKANEKKTGGTDEFTKSQLNNGAQNAGLGLDEFKGLAYNVKNFFVNASAANIADIQGAISSVKSGDVTPEDAKSEIDSLAVPQDVKDYLKSLIDKNAPTQKASAPSESFISRYNPFGGAGFITNVKEGFKNLIGM